MSAQTTIVNQPTFTATNSGNSGPLSVANVSEILVGVNLTAGAGNGGILICLDIQGPDGNWYQVEQSPSLDAPSVTVFGFTPPTLETFPPVIRFRWILESGQTSVTFNYWAVGQ